MTATPPLPIITVDSPQQHILRTKTTPFTLEQLPEARQIAIQLTDALTPFMPAAGLAAPQIGISRSIFIYSYDRDPKHLEVIINPHFTPVGTAMVEGWEGCFSVILSDKTWKLAKIPRYEKIEVTYLNVDGESVKKELEGFAAKVFQHEYDHLQGIANIDRPDATVKIFTSKAELDTFMQAVKNEDAKRYNPPPP